MTAARILFLICLISGGSCLFVPAAHITEYAPELGGINCLAPCDLTAYLEPIRYGETAACGPSIPYGTQVYIESVGWRTCLDRGGAIDDQEVDIATHPDDLYTQSGYYDTVWILDPGLKP